MHHTTIDFHNARGKPLQKGAIVSDEDHSARKPEEYPLEPPDGGQIQMVGRLVEEQELGFGHQGPAQGHAPPPPPGECFHAGAAGQGQLGEHRLHLLLRLPSLHGVQLRLKRRELVEVHSLRRFRAQRLQRCQALKLRRQGLPEIGPHGKRTLLWQGLGQGAHPEPSPALHGPAVGRDLPAQDLEERRLAGPVAPNEADPLPELQGKAGLLEDGAVSKVDGERIAANEAQEALPR